MTRDLGERESGAAPALNGASDKPHNANRPLREVCYEMKKKVDAFLSREPDTPLLAKTQAQLRVSLQVVDEALEKYRCVASVEQATTCTSTGH